MLLVTGGAGFIGANFVLSALARTGEPIVTLDKLTYAGSRANLRGVRGDSRHLLVQEDICNAPIVRKLLREHQPRAVVHFAAESHVDRSIGAPEAFVHTNVVGTLRLLEEATGLWRSLPARQAAAFRFLQISTDEVYGSLESSDPPANEQARYAPNSPYAASKAAADHLVRAFNRTYGLPTLITNCSNNYGPFQFPEKLIPLTIRNAVSGRAVGVYGDGTQLRDWIYVADHCSALQRVLEHGRPGEVYNIGTGEGLRNIDVVTRICELLDRLQPLARGSHADLIRFVVDRPGHDQRYAIDAGKLRRELGWRPRESFESGLAKTVRWYLSHHGWLEQAARRAA